LGRHKLRPTSGVRVRGSILFDQQTYALTAQAGRMVGLEKQERLCTPGAVVELLEDTIQQAVALAALLQSWLIKSGNTDCQGLAIILLH
jgi:magnesium transporter